MRTALWATLSLIVIARAAAAEDFPRGVVVENVQCQDNAQQHYSLYLPSSFTPTRKWPVILGFDPGARGQRAVEAYRVAAEKYGYIVVGSNNSRNGPWEPILEAAAAMQRDVEARFPIDSKRRYAAGMSGGAHVVMKIALTHGDIAGALVSSSAFEDGEFKETVSFPIFGTMGIEDFDYDEVHQLEQMKSAHRVETFDGGHQWPPAPVVMNGIQWMELYAMKRGLRAKDARFVDNLFAKRMSLAEAQKSILPRLREFEAIAEDFGGLKDVSDVSRRAGALERDPQTREALAAEQAETARQERVRQQVYDVVDATAAREPGALAKLKIQVKELVDDGKAPEDSPRKGFARRMLAAFRAEIRDIAEGDRELLAMLDEFRPAGGQR